MASVSSSNLCIHCHCWHYHSHHRYSKNNTSFARTIKKKKHHANSTFIFALLPAVTIIITDLELTGFFLGGGVSSITIEAIKAAFRCHCESFLKGWWDFQLHTSFGQGQASTAAAVCSELPMSSCWQRERTRARNSRGCHWCFHYLSWQFSLLGNHTVTGECPHDDKNLPRWSALEKDIESPPAPGSRSAVLQLWACFLSSLWELSKWKGDFSFFLPGVFM